MNFIPASVLANISFTLLDDTKKNLIDMGFVDVDGIDTSNRFLEWAQYNEEINTLPITAQEYKTPSLFSVDGGDVINNPDYDIYYEEVALEFLGFEAQRQIFRRLLESYVNYIRGKKITVYYSPYKDMYVYNKVNLNTGREIQRYEFTYEGNDLFDGQNVGDYESDDNICQKITLVMTTDYPNISETFNQSGFERFQAYVNFEYTVMSGITLSDDISFIVDGQKIPYTTLDINRVKTVEAYNVKTDELKHYAQNQSLNITFSGLLNTNNSTIRKIKEDILHSSYLNREYNIEIDGVAYSMLLKSGSISAKINEVATFSCELITRQEV